MATTTLTLDYLKTKFKKYNAMYFKGVLPLPSFKITNSRKTLGQYRRRNYTYFKSHTICISNYYLMNEKQIDNTLIHEMIHYYISYTNTFDTSSHGIVFKQHCERINKDGWNLSRCEDVSEWEIRPQGKVYYMCIFHNTQADSPFIFRYCETKRKDYEKFFKEKNYKYKFFTSTDIAFDSFSTCRKIIKGFYTYNTKYQKYQKLLEQ